MVKSRIRHKKPIMGLPYTPYRETCMSGESQNLWWAFCMKKYLTIFLLSLFVLPSVALASWWNPFSWRIFNKPTEIKIEKSVVTPPESTVSASSTSIKPPKVIKKDTSTSFKDNIKTTTTAQKEESVDLKIEQCKATKENSYNNAILKLNQAIDTKLQETFNSLEQQHKEKVDKIYSNVDIQKSRIWNDTNLTGESKLSLVSSYNYDASEQVKTLYDNQQIFWKNQKQEIESSKQKAMDKINVLLSEEYSKCLSK